MKYAIRHRDGQVVASHAGDLRGLEFPDDDTVETFDDADAFHARLADLTPEPDPDPADDLHDRIQTVHDAAPEGPVKQLAAALLGVDPDARGQVAARPRGDE